MTSPDSPEDRADAFEALCAGRSEGQVVEKLIGKGWSRDEATGLVQSLAGKVKVFRAADTDGSTSELRQREAGVPRRFGVGTAIVITTMFAVLFAILQALRYPPVAVLVIALFFGAVGLGCDEWQYRPRPFCPATASLANVFSS